MALPKDGKLSPEHLSAFPTVLTFACFLFFFFFFFGGATWWGSARAQSTAYRTGLGRRGSHPTGGGASGEMLYARTRSRGPVWDWHRADGLGGLICFAPGGASVSYPLKPQDACTIRGGGLRCSWSIWPRCRTPSLFSELSYRIGTRSSVGSQSASSR